MVQSKLKWLAVVHLANLTSRINGKTFSSEVASGDALGTHSSRAHTFENSDPVRKSYDPAVMRLQKRSPVHREEKIRNKSDYHRKLSISSPHGLGTRKGAIVNHNHKQRKWSDREQNLFNEDHEGMLEQVRQQGAKMAFSTHDLKSRERSRKNAEFWHDEANKTARQKPFYDQRKIVMALRLSKQDQTRAKLDFDEAKYRGRMDALFMGDVEKIKALEKEAHIKSLKAGQAVDDWHKLGPKYQKYFRKPSLFRISVNEKHRVRVPDKLALVSRVTKKIDMEGLERYTKALDVNGDISMSSTSKPHKEASIPSPGYATDAERIGKKLEAADPSTWPKWALRSAGMGETGDPAARINAEMYYHNKEQSKRWNQLHWASVEYNLRRQQAARDREARSSPQSSP